MILSVTLNPCVDHTLFLTKLLVGDTNRVVRVESDAGGKGINLSRVAHELGGITLATGLVGGGNGAFIRHRLDAESVPHEFIEIANETRANTNIETEERGTPTTLNSPGPLIQVPEWDALVALVSARAAESSWVALGGSMPPGVPEDGMIQLAEKARAAGAKVLIDADGKLMQMAMDFRPDLIKPNRAEAERLIGAFDDPLDAAHRLRELLGGDRAAMISLGAGGAVLATPEGVYVGESPTVEACSTIGSGDSLLGGFLARRQAGDPWPIAFQWGLAAGAATATTNGAEIARRSVVELLVEHAHVHSA